MADFIVGVVAGVLLLWLFQWVLAWMIQRQVDQQVAELERLIKTQTQMQTVWGRVEEVNGVFYVYNQNTDEFLAQGADLAEIDLVIKQRWPDRTVLVKSGEDNVVQRLKATQ